MTKRKRADGKKSKTGPKKGTGGRPPIVLTDEQRIAVEAHAQWCSQDTIADLLEISRTTLQQLIKRDPELSARYKKGKARADMGVAKSLVQSAMAGAAAQQIFYCKTQLGWKEESVV